MNILVTGSSGDLGSLLVPRLQARGDEVTGLDIQAPLNASLPTINGSILDRGFVQEALFGMDAIVHIAAWHGIHEFRREASRSDFWDLNVTGTFNLLEACRTQGVRKFLFISSTSVHEQDSFYGQSKRWAEQICKDYNLELVILRPRAFIPHWNRNVYKDFVAWAAWFWKGSVHISDVVEACARSIELLRDNTTRCTSTFEIDGAYDFSAETLAHWDEQGMGTSFRTRFPEYVALAKHYDLPIALAPQPLVRKASEASLPGFTSHYSLENLLKELACYGAEGPPSLITPRDNAQTAATQGERR